MFIKNLENNYNNNKKGNSGKVAVLTVKDKREKNMG